MCPRKELRFSQGHSWDKQVGQSETGSLSMFHDLTASLGVTGPGSGGWAGEGWLRGDWFGARGGGGDGTAQKASLHLSRELGRGRRGSTRRGAALRAQRSSSDFLEKWPRKTQLGLLKASPRPSYFHHWPQITALPSPTSYSLGNFPTPLQEKNKERTTNADGNDSTVPLTAVGGDRQLGGQGTSPPPARRSRQVGGADEKQAHTSVGPAQPGNLPLQESVSSKQTC